MQDISINWSVPQDNSKTEKLVRSDELTDIQTWLFQLICWKFCFWTKLIYPLLSYNDASGSYWWTTSCSCCWEIYTHLSCISSPISAGRLRNLLLDRSSVRRLTNIPTSAGSRKSWLSFRYNAVRCSNSHSEGLMFLTQPARSMEELWWVMDLFFPKVFSYTTYPWSQDHSSLFSCQQQYLRQIEISAAFYSYYHICLCYETFYSNCLLVRGKYNVENSISSM